MTKTILITGATDGIGLQTAKTLLKQDHRLLVHGRNADKLQKTLSELSLLGPVKGYLADLSDFSAVKKLANELIANAEKIDVLINNAGVFQSPVSKNANGIDIRFAVNTIAPYLLTQQLFPILNDHARVINLSSAAQAPVSLDALQGKRGDMEAMNAYAQSKLAIILWGRAMAEALGENSPMIVAVNPGSLLASKMVKEGFGIAGNDLQIGADILTRAALSEDFANATGQYFDNDSGRFAKLPAQALDRQKCADVVTTIDAILQQAGC